MENFIDYYNFKNNELNIKNNELIIKNKRNRYV